MIFLIDAQLPPDLCRWFAAQGHQAIHDQPWCWNAFHAEAQRKKTAEPAEEKTA